MGGAMTDAPLANAAPGLTVSEADEWAWRPSEGERAYSPQEHEAFLQGLAWQQLHGVQPHTQRVQRQWGASAEPRTARMYSGPGLA